ncbi:MAG: LysE family transporter [Cellulomonas sp.]|uniref:LysE family transporter n=1 Tax=Cellulomonas sp. TaxID=40001 RepID=UPI002590176E|nr:LysE family transporter [Cellulomonas sp.]MCR6704666.1 LysE family transporter [Cellulomonas sp.]
MLATSPVLSAAALGVVAGLSVAVPVGPVAVLIVREGLVRGRRAGVAAAAGVATVDLTYAMLAVLLGAQVSRLLAGWEQGLRVGGAVVLALVGIVGLVRWWRSRGAAGPDALAAGPDEPAGSSVRAARVWGRFVVITLLNPATALIFATVAVGLAGRLVAGPGALVAFAIGAGAASLAWQCVLGLAGAWAGGRLGARWQEWSAPVGSGLVVLLAAWVAVA